MKKNDIILTITVVGSLAFLTLVFYGVWIGTDPSNCKETSPLKQNACLSFTWGMHILLILFPSGIIITVIRIFRSTSEESDKSEEVKAEPQFDYSKMGASSEQPFRHKVP